MVFACKLFRSVLIGYQGPPKVCTEGGALRENGLLRGYRAYPKGNDRPKMQGGR
jgi:hypothetical protein